MKKIVCFVLACIPFICLAQSYKYIGKTEGLINQKIYRICKGANGYMWFLTQHGVDRYNGKDIKHYQLINPETNTDKQTNFDWAYTDNKGTLWIIGKKGRIFQYDTQHDCFKLVYQLPKQRKKNSHLGISCGYLDKNNQIWLCEQDSITLFDTYSQETNKLPLPNGQKITSIEQIDSLHYYIGTTKGLVYTQLKNGILSKSSCTAVDSIQVPINALYFHQPSNKLFIGTFRDGILAHNLKNHTGLIIDTSLSEVNITRIVKWDDKHVLAATDGQGVFRIHTDSCKAIPYIEANHESYTEMNGNNINDILVDEKKRIWMANYPAGITIRDNRYTNYQWIKHSQGYEQSLPNNQVHHIMEDSEGDVWYATSNGIGFYNSVTNKWQSFATSYKSEQEYKNHIFLTLCEVSPGIIWAGGYSPYIYQIDKRKLSMQKLNESAFGDKKQANQYIRTIYRDSKNNIWVGGYNDLICYDLSEKRKRKYAFIGSVTTLKEKDENTIWVGTLEGLYQLHKESGKYDYIEIPPENRHICSLYQQGDNLYIGTGGSGLLIYNIQKQNFVHYYTENSALISNNIYTIIPKSNGNLLLSTENGIANYQPKEQIFRNWGKEQGLQSVMFNANAGIHRKNGNFILGSNDGAIEFAANIQIPELRYSPMILSDFKVSYQLVYPGDDNSPLTNDINHSQRIRLKYSQNTFSLKASNVDYDHPSNILYSWKLKGFYNEWSRPSTDGNISFTNLAPGDYTLYIRTVSNEEKYHTYQVRSIRILIESPLWASNWALVIYAGIIIFIITISYHMNTLKRNKLISEEKTRFFINTAHDIRTPLTLVKAPLEEMIINNQVKNEGITNIQLALRNVEILLQQVTNLINYEKADMQISTLNIKEYELRSYITELHNSFKEYAEIRKLNLYLEIKFPYINVWFDKEKMNSIISNLITNAIKYTPEGGDIKLTVNESNDVWNIEICDTGIGIPINEQKKLFKSYYRGSNVLNKQISGNGIGLMLVNKLIQQHKGKIQINSIEQEGTYINITFPKHIKDTKKLTKQSTNKTETLPEKNVNYLLKEYNTKQSTQIENNYSLNRPTILIVEDNTDLRNYLKDTLKDTYNVHTCSNGSEGLDLINEVNPELIISDIMMPEMSGNEMCKIIKQQIETSHIPVILLTALNNEEHMIEGLNIGADDYITKPFHIGVLKASISNLLTNRKLLYKKYGNIILSGKNDNENIDTNKDLEFVAAVRKSIEENLTNDNFNVDVLCAKHNMSRTAFFNKIKTLTGQPPSELIRIIRLQRAADLLKQGYKTTEVSDMCGFCDTRHFRMVFKKHFNENPSDYRKNVG